MLYYEWKKTFTRRRLITIITILAIVSVWEVYVTEHLLSLSIEDLPDPFGQFIGMLDYLNILMWLILVTIVSTLFTKEWDTGMAPILQTSRHGRNEVAKAKLALTLLFANTLYALYVFVMLLSYYFALDMDFNIPITEGYELELATNPGIQTFGDIILIQTLGFFFEINFIALVCLFLQQKLKKGFSTAVIMYIACVANLGATFIPNLGIPIFDQIINLTPLCFTHMPITYKVLLYLGPFAVSPVHIGFVVYTVLIVLLICFFCRQSYRFTAS